MTKSSKEQENHFFQYKNGNSIEEILLIYKTEIQKLIVEAIDISFNMDYDQYIVTKIRNPKSPFGHSHDIILNRGEWNSLLKIAKDHFEETEDYEYCSYIKDLTERINTDFSGHPEYGP